MGEREVREIVVTLLEEICGDEVVRTEPDVDLLAEELLDSLDYTELLIGIEEQTGVVMAPSELRREDMNTPAKIVRQILQRMGQ